MTFIQIDPSAFLHVNSVRYLRRTHELSTCIGKSKNQQPGETDVYVDKRTVYWCGWPHSQSLTTEHALGQTDNKFIPIPDPDTRTPVTDLVSQIQKKPNSNSWSLPMSCPPQYGKRIECLYTWVKYRQRYRLPKFYYWVTVWCQCHAQCSDYHYLFIVVWFL